MPLPTKSLKSASLFVVLLPILALTQQGPPQAAGGQQQATAGGAGGAQQGPANGGGAAQGQQGPPGGAPQGGSQQGPVKGTQNPPANGAPGKTTNPPGGTGAPAGHPNGGTPAGGTPVEVGDPWDSLKFDSKYRIQLWFRNANVDNIIFFLEKASHVTIIKDPILTGTMTVTTADKVSLSEAFHVFNSVLKLKGFEITRDRKNLMITLIKHPQPPPPPPPQMVMAPPGPDPNAVVVKFYPLTYANAVQVARSINEVFESGPMPNQQQQFGIVFGGPGGQPRQPGQAGPSVRASYEEFSNSVIVKAPPAEQAQVEALIKDIDKRQSEPQRTKTYKLTYATATDVLPSVQNVLTSNLGKGKGAKEQNPLLQIFGFGNQTQNLAVADARTNSIIVTGTEDLLTIADQVIADLDQKMSYTSTTFVFKLENARADTVANLLTAAYGQRQGSQSNSQNKVITPTNNTFSNTSGGSSSSGSRSGSPSVATPNAASSQSMPLSLKDPNADSGDLLTSVGVTQGFFGFYGGQDGSGNGRRNQNNGGIMPGHDKDGKFIGVHDLSGQVTAVADPNTNSVIVVTAPDNFDLIKEVLDQLDKIPEQVMIQTIVVEATLDKAQQFGVEWSFAQNKAFGGNSTGTGTQGFGLQNASPPLQGFSYALTGGDLTAFFNMLQTDTKFQVLSTPRIFTSNNMEAQINISQSIPYIVSTLENINGTSSFNYAFQDVGIVLTVTPHITSNGYVTMDVLQTANDLQGYTSFNAPIVNQREAETTISAKDGQTIILGGMIRSQVTATVNKVPLLGDIPVLGNLFKSTNTDKQKTELLVFLTPYVVRDPAEAKKLKDESQAEVSPGMKNIIKEQLPPGAKAKLGG